MLGAFLVGTVALGGCAGSDPGDIAVDESGLVTYVAMGRRLPEVPEPRDPRTAARAAALVDNHGDEFLGSYVDEDGEVVVVAGTDAGYERAARVAALAAARIERSEWTLDALTPLGERIVADWPGDSWDIVGFGADPETGGLSLTVDDELSDADRSYLESFATDNELLIRVEIYEGPVFSY